MPQLVKKRRSGWAVLAATTLVASLLAVAASPAGAQSANDKADVTSVTLACVGDALGDHMFADVSDEHAFKNAINCVAYYGITNGTGDGSTYSPNQDVTRAEMAVFISRAAGVAGVDIGSGSGGFSDIGGVWQEAQDAINALAGKGMIPSGGAFRPDDAITRAEMATFLIGLMVQGAPNVWKDTQGTLTLSKGNSITTASAWDWFADARASVPAENDGEISALFELGVTKGASAAAVQNKYRPPLDTNYEPFGTVNRGEMAEFITRALAHTSARPEGVTAQYDWIASNVVVSMRDGDFAPVAGEVVDVIRIPTTSEDAAFKGNGECSVDVDIVMIGTGEHGCEIDGADPITGGDGDARVAFDGVDDGGTTVWAWTGEEGDELDDDTTLYRLEITTDPPRPASRVRITSSHPGIKKVHLGSSVVYTVQLQDHLGDVTIGPDATDPRPSRFFVTLSTYAIVPSGATFDDTQPVSPTNNLLARNAQGASVRTTIPLITDDDGKATFTVSGLPDSNPLIDRDEYVVEIHIQGQPGPAGNAPPIAAYYLGSSDMAATPSATGLVAVREGASAADYWGGLVFSTEPNDSSRLPVTDGDGTVVPGISVSVSAAAKYIASNGRGASTRATVTASDQYNDPIAGAAVSLGTNATDDGEMVPIVIASGRAIATGRDGSYTFGYTRENAASFVETLTGSWNHDGDDGTTPAVMGTATVRWAALADDAETVGQQIRSFDTDTNTIYAGLDDATNGVIVFYYDENDRYNIISGGATSTTTYAGFERNLSTYTGYLVTWDAYNLRGRAVNEFTLTVPPAP
jgi:hypothetical protein